MDFVKPEISVISVGFYRDVITGTPSGTLIDSTHKSDAHTFHFCRFPWIAWLCLIGKRSYSVQNYSCKYAPLVLFSTASTIHMFIYNPKGVFDDRHCRRGRNPETFG